MAVKYVIEPKGSVEGKTLSWEHLDKKEQATILGSINFQKPTPTSALQMTGSVSYQVDKTAEMHSLAFTIDFNFVEMIREMPMETSEYFKIWGTSKAEQKVEIKSTLRNTRLFAEKAQKIFHVAIVDVNDACMYSFFNFDCYFDSMNMIINSIQFNSFHFNSIFQSTHF